MYCENSKEIRSFEKEFRSFAEPIDSKVLETP